MKPGLRFFIGTLLFAAGLLAGARWKHLAPASSSTAPTTRVVETQHAATYATLTEAIRQAPELVLEDLARDPYLTLTDAELALLAATVDLRKENHRRLLNGVSPPDFRQKLWIAVLRESITKMPLQEVMKLSEEGRAGTQAFWGPIVDAIHASPDRKDILESEWGKGYLQVYLDMAPYRIPRLQDALDLVPPGKTGPEMRERLIEGWIYGNPSAENVREIFKLRNLPMRQDLVFANAVFSVWRDKPEQLPALMAAVDTLPPPQRNRLVSSLIAARPPETAGDMADMLSHFTSAEYQRQLTDSWLEKKGADFREQLLQDLEARQGDPRLVKIREHLRAKEGGK